jgi:protein tyrosine phosphatase
MHFTDQVSSFDEWSPPHHLYDIKKYDEFCKVIAKKLPTNQALIMFKSHTRQNISEYKDYQQDMSRKNVLAEYESDGACPVMRNMMNQETQKLIEAIYQRDFEYFSANEISMSVPK